MKHKGKYIRQQLYDAGLQEKYEILLPDMVDEAEKRFTRKLLRGSDYFGGFNRKDSITPEHLEKRLNIIRDRFDPDYVGRVLGIYRGGSLVIEQLCHNYPEFIELRARMGKGEFQSAIADFLREELHRRGGFYDRLMARFTREKLLTLLATDSRFRFAASALLRKTQILEALSRDFMNSTPDNYASLYPAARALTREFIFHIGPTNSGKTYEAIQALMAAPTGAYLAPLRLLAYEQYENMTAHDVPCSMITGEERILVPGAKHQASTIEMMDLEARYDTVVIDEAQMIADPSRGGSWTAAILGILADHIHVCASEDALECITRMVEDCGDTWTVQYHKRKTPLIPETDEFHFPRDVQDGDALILFSRRDVHACAADLADRGISCSIIYGNLPYDVRHQEAEKFAHGETRVVVATDAIGMGMNLPIRRVVFLKTDKFDGKDVRELSPSEIKQIAGRAGRYGIYDQGFVTAFAGLKFIRWSLRQPYEPIEKAVINIPPVFFESEGKISEILDAWNGMPATQDYEKSDIEIKIALARELEEYSDNKGLILEFTSIAFDEKNAVVHGIWLELFRCMVEGMEPDLEETFREFDPARCEPTIRNAEVLETMYKVYDLLYVYVSKHGSQEDEAQIIRTKRAISDKIIEILAKNKFQKRVCMTCGRKLPWFYPYRVCEQCHNRERRRK